MANIDTLLKSEISRLARKQIRAEIEPLKRAALQHRGHVASLRRQVEALEREIKQFAKTGKRMSGGSPEGSQEPSDERPLRFRASGLASHRKRLGLSAADFGKLLGVPVSPCTNGKRGRFGRAGANWKQLRRSENSDAAKLWRG